VRTAISKHTRDFVAIILLCLAGLAVGTVILSHQRLYLPKWVPGLGTDFVDYKAAFSTSQSVTPGQGQTVQIAGVDIGEISSVDLVDGRAIVTMKIRHRYAPLYRDASALLRPKTGLNDMVVELTPGHRSAGAAPPGWTIPVDRTEPNVNFDEILSSLDADTRSYLQLLIGGAGQALGGQSRNVSNALKRFEPTGRSLAQLNGALAQRQANIKRTIHNFGLLSQALGNKDRQLSQLVASSNSVFRAFAHQDARLRESLSLLPGALDATNKGLGKADKLAKVLGPTLGKLRPAARSLGPSLKQTRPFLEQTMPVIRDQLRPFARDALPVVKILRPAARDLAEVTPNLTTSVQVLNYLVNELAYNPPGPQEGYLYWVSWANHLGANIFNTQDANGPIRRGLVLASCSSLQTLANIGKANQLLGTLATLLNSPTTEQVCGQKSSQAGGTTPVTGATSPLPTLPSVPGVTRSATPKAGR
jgi:phospholipid/cholesterol/gamma-HCH transport system substrate-binding protein